MPVSEPRVSPEEGILPWGDVTTRGRRGLSSPTGKVAPRLREGPEGVRHPPRTRPVSDKHPPGLADSASPP